MKFQWIGGPSFLLEAGNFRVLCDPVFGDGESRQVSRSVSLPEFSLDGLDAVLVTRNQVDHFDTEAASRIGKRVRAFAPERGIKSRVEEGFENVTTLDWWEHAVREKSGYTMEITAVPTRLPDSRRSGDANGYMIRFTDGKRTHLTYWTGDTLWFSDTREIKERFGQIDLLVVHLGAVETNGSAVTLDGKEAMQFVFMFQPKRILPINHNTFSYYREPVDAFKERISLTMYERRLINLVEGETYEWKVR
ncbi:MAG: MBL fold metallo-hydrolase [bacterium]|nr:MBL fold metallo-hydrolase [bacterium]